MTHANTDASDENQASTTPAAVSKNANLSAAKTAKNDEFYTQWADVEREMNAYLDYDPDVFRGKVVLLPCDDPEWSNFTKFFALRFSDLGLKMLISTSYAADAKSTTDYEPTELETTAPQYDPSKTLSRGKKFTLTAQDVNGDGVINIEDLQWEYLNGDGDFRSDEVTALRDEADIVITNPPFSLFREYLAWLMEGHVKFAAIGNTNAITYKEVFPLIKDSSIWLGTSAPKAFRDGDHSAEAPLKTFGNIRWFTNIEHGRRHAPLQLMTKAENIKHSPRKEVRGVGYTTYDNYKAIEVPFVEAIPADYAGIMGVPISFLDRHNPDQFEILWQASGNTKASAPAKVLKELGYKQHKDDRGGCGVVGGKRVYSRILIRRKVAK
jgi:hypothetical protein